MHVTLADNSITWLTFAVPFIVGLGAGLGWFIASALVSAVRSRKA